MGVARTVLDAVSLPLRPWRLAAAAVSVPTWAGVLAGCAGALVCLGLRVGAVVGGSEPFPDMASYTVSWAHLSVFAALFSMVFVAPVVGLAGPLYHAFRAPLDRLLARAGPVLRARVVVVSLSLYAALVPLCIWSYAAAVASVPHPFFNMSGGKPGWVYWPVWQFISQERWLYLWWALVGALALWQCGLVPAAVLRRAAESGPRCGSCGYPRAGLAETAVCPECGADLKAQATPTASGAAS